jgi:photosystem II stability/assembly factor-like uncharacterized protein
MVRNLPESGICRTAAVAKITFIETINSETSVMKHNFSVVFAALAFAIGAISSSSAETLGTLAQHTHYHGIAFVRSGTATLLLASHHGVYALDNNGTATRVSPIQDFMGFAPDPANPMSYYASGHPAGGGNSGFLHSTDGGANWKQLSPGVEGPVDFHQMDVSTADPKTIYGGYGSIQVSRDGGATWKIAGNPPPDLIAIAASKVNVGQLYAATKNGLHMSEDAGATWKPLFFGGEIVSTVETGPGNAVYAFVIGRGLMTANEPVSTEWTLLSNDFGESIPLHLAVDEKDSQHLALTTHANEVLESRDGGKTWRAFGKGAD